jgi:hypothetical protein
LIKKSAKSKGCEFKIAKFVLEPLNLKTMRKTKLIYLPILLAIIVLFQSCSKDAVIELTTYNVPQATIKGKVFAELNTTAEFPGLEYAPNGTKIILQIAVDQFGIDVSGSPQNSYKNYETTVSGSGDYTFTFDATTFGIDIWLYANQFEYQKVIGKDAQGQPITVRTVYAFTPAKITGIIGGQTVYKDIVYAIKTK